MDIQVRCGFCEASNLSSAFACSECFMPLIDELTTPEHASEEFGSLEAAAPVGASAGLAAADVDVFTRAGVGAAPAPPSAPPKPFGPYTGPAREKPAKPETVEEPEAERAAVPLPGYRIGSNVIAGVDAATASAPLRAPRDPNRVLWRWHHVLALALLAWGLPFAVDWWLGVDRSIAALLNRSLAVQIVGYLVAALAVAAMVWTRQKGDWTTLGLGDDARQGRIDLLRGVGFGLAMFLGYLPIGLFTNGRTSLDPVISLLLGNANGMGLVLTCAVVVVGAPLVEEIFFRGLLYEKIARRWPQIAILVTSVVFMLVHRAIVLQILLLGLVFAVKRSKGETVWYTIGAHAAWNASVTVAGLVMLTTSMVQFTSPAGSYELKYARDWEREKAMEMTLPQGRIDLGLMSPNGSVIGVVEIPDVPTLSRLGTSRLLDQMPASLSGAGGTVTNVDVEPTTLPGASAAYEIEATLSAAGMSLDYQMVAAQAQGSEGLTVFMLMCPQMSCDASIGDFEEMMETVRFL